MVENYLLAKKVAADKCGSDSEFYPFMVCALYGLFTKYKGNNEMIANLFMDTAIIFEEGKVEDIIRRNNIDVDDFDLVHDNDEEGITTYGVSNQGHSFYTDADGNVSYERSNPFVICSLDHENMAHFLNTFCHEFGHLIKGEEKGHSSEETEDHFTFIIRTGLAHYVYHYQDHFRDFRFISAFSVLDEAINCIQTTDVLEEILSLRDFVEDEDIKSFLQSLDENEMRKDRGYEYIVKLVRELWKNDSFRSVVEENIVNGDIDAIINSFNVVMGNDAFEDMSSKLDSIYDLCEDNEDGILDSLVSSYQEDVQKYFKAESKQKRK